MAETVAETPVVEKRSYLRFPLAYRIEHWVQMASFTILAITGLPQKFSEAGLSKAFIGLLGGIEVVRVIHRISATILMLAVVYHIGIVLYRMYVKRFRPSMLPGLADLRNAIQAFRYNLGLGKTRPQQGRYTFEEKAEYWAFVWGTMVMVFTGFMLWNPIATARFLPGQFIPAAKAAHGGEALLAVLAIILWHMYHVHIRTFNRSMFKGTISEEEMLHEHPLELADIKAGVAQPVTNPQAKELRRRMFWPVYAIIGGLLLFGIYAFVSFEQTAIDTLPPAEQVAVFAPLTPTPLPTLPPTPTPVPTPEGQAGSGEGGSEVSAGTWEGNLGGLFKTKCGTCHGSGTKLGELDLSAYLGATAGGKSGPGIVPGDPDASQIIIIQSAGGHPGQLSDEELAQVRAWIEAGAPEK
jgi:cytochrome b subunit of formate dehydrogenase